MSKGFAVVEFSKEGTVESVPTSWLTDNREKCYWPPGPKASRLITINASPKDDWITLDVDVLKYCDTLLKARVYAKKAEESSNLESETSDFGHGKRKLTQKVQQSFKRRQQVISKPEGDVIHSSNDESDGSDSNSDKVHNIEKTIDGIGASNEAEANVQNLNSDPVPLPTEYILANTLDFDSFKEEFRRFEGVILTALTRLETKVEAISIQGGRIFHDDYEIAREAIENFDPPPPFGDLIGFQTFLTWLESDAKNIAKAIIYFGSIGGKTAKAATDKILNRLLKKQLALRYSLTGKSSRGSPAKLPFKKTPAFQVIFRSVKASEKTKNATEDEVEKRIATYLRTAGDKEGGREIRRISVNTGD